MKDIVLFVIIFLWSFIQADWFYKLGQQDAVNGKSQNNVAIIKVNKSTQDSIKMIPKMFEEFKK